MIILSPSVSILSLMTKADGFATVAMMFDIKNVGCRVKKKKKKNSRMKMPMRCQ